MSASVHSDISSHPQVDDEDEEGNVEIELAPFHDHVQEADASLG